MRVTRIGWAGTRTDRYAAMVEFLTAVLGLPLVQQERDFAVLDLPSGDRFEVLGPSAPDNQYFTTGPVVGFVSRISPLPWRSWSRPMWSCSGGHVDERGGGWRQFRTSDGNVYELGSG